MLRLLSIEFFKLRNNKFFWILSGLFLLFLLAVPLAGKGLFNYLDSIGETLPGGLVPSDFPFFDFVDIWQNLTWIYKSFSIFLGFIIVISVCNEYSFGTVKQNVIDGMSRREFLWSKIIYIITSSFVVSQVALIIGLIAGYLWSPVKEFVFVVKHIEFIWAYFLHLMAFQMFCLVISLLIKRSGITIALLTFYVYVIEPIISNLTFYYYEMETLANLYPMTAIGNIIPFPFGKYVMQETQTTIGMDDLGILLGYIALLWFLADRIVVKKDLR